MGIVPELYVSDIEASKQFFVEVLGFSVKYERREEQFAYLAFCGNALMLEGLQGKSRKWLTDTLESPFGRGVNFQWEVDNVDKRYQRVKHLSPQSIYLPIETKRYRRNINGINDIVEQTQFIVQSPDGYLFRFCAEK